MNPEEELEQLIESGDCDAMLLFLKTRTTKERRSYASAVSKLSQEYSGLDSSGRLSPRIASKEQLLALTCAKIACYNKQLILKDEPDWVLDGKTLENLLAFYVPEWFNDFINLFARRAWLPTYINYDLLVRLSRQGILRPEPELLAKTLVNYPYKWQEYNSVLLIERLYDFEETINEHVWYLFQFDTTIHNSGLGSAGDKDQQKQNSWIGIFTSLAAKGELDRIRLLGECIGASNRNFNRNLSSFFAECFMQLEPSNEEIIHWQQHIFVLLSSPHSKVKKVALLACKRAVGEPSFAGLEFLDAVTPALVATEKSIIVLALQLIDTLAKSQRDIRPKVGLAVIPAFISKDSDVQTRAARLIARYGTDSNEQIRNLLTPYVPTLFSSAREIISDFIDAERLEQTDVPDPEPQQSQEGLSPIPSIRSIDDVVFLCSQAFDNRESWNIDLLPSTLVLWNDKIEGDVIKKLEPSFQKALKIWTGSLPSGSGELEVLLSAFFIDYGALLMKKNPGDTERIRTLYDQAFEKQTTLYEQWKEHGTSLSFMNGWRASNKVDIYDTYFNLFLEVLMHIRNGVALPLLSTPTHAPCWIDPVILVQRIITYQEQRVHIGSVDLQIAISRCMLRNTEKALQLAKEELSGDIRKILEFLFGSIHVIPKHDPVFTPHWTVAAIANRHTDFSKDANWNVGMKSFEIDDYEFINNELRRVKRTIEEKVLRVELSFSNRQTIYDWRTSDKEYFVVSPNDICRLIMLVPNNPEPLLAEIINDAFAFNRFEKPVDRRIAEESIKALYSIWSRMGETGHLFLAVSMVASDATVTAYAAELWLKGVQQQAIDNCRLGKIIGKLYRWDYALLSRFADLVIDRLLQASTAHGLQLQAMLTEVLKYIPDEGARHLKKLLEIYKELLRINRSHVEDIHLQQKFEHWKKSGSLRNVLGPL